MTSTVSGVCPPWQDFWQRVAFCTRVALLGGGIIQRLISLSVPQFPVCGDSPQRWQLALCSPPPGSNIRAVLVNVNAPETRGTVFGFFCIMDDVGKGPCLPIEPLRTPVRLHLLFDGSRTAVGCATRPLPGGSLLVGSVIQSAQTFCKESKLCHFTNKKGGAILVGPGPFSRPTPPRRGGGGSCPVSSWEPANNLFPAPGPPCPPS